MITALLASLCMLAQDIIGTVMVMSEAAGKGWLAGGMDVVGYYVAFLSTWIGVDIMDGHSTALKVLFFALMSVANLLGTKSGQVLGSRLLKHFPAPPDPWRASVDERLAALEKAK